MVHSIDRVRERGKREETETETERQSQREGERERERERERETWYNTAPTKVLPLNTLAMNHEMYALATLTAPRSLT